MSILQRAGFSLLLALLIGCAVSLGHAAPPEIRGGTYLSARVGDNPQSVLTYETSAPFEVTLFDPDAGDALSYQIVVAGPLGGVIGGAAEGSAGAGVPVTFPVRFISGIVPGASWILITVSDGTASATRYINFDILPHPSPPSGRLFRVSHADAGYRYHFNVLITDPAEIQRGLDILARKIPQQIVAGHVVKGDAGFNVNLQDPEQATWSWYLDPVGVHFAEAFPEVCDGLDCFVEFDLEYWVNQISFFCPWTTFLLPYNPSPPVEPLRISLDGSSQTVVRWDPVPGATHYDVARGLLSSLTRAECSIALDPLVCLADDTTLTSSPPDAESPLAGEGFFYLVRYHGPSLSVGWGTSFSVLYRDAASGCVP